MIKYFCSSDIHSFFDIWQRALSGKEFDINNIDHKIIICGDLFDRGTQSVACYEFAKQLHDQGRLIYVRGNHEDLLEQCVDGVRKGLIEEHHIHNGTLKTLAQFMNCSEYDLLCGCYDETKFDKITAELLNFINDVTKDYFELGSTVFVHGWVPTTCTDDKRTIVHTNWREGGWKRARWENGIDMYYMNILPADVTRVVCGHWHANYAWHLFRHRSEWGTDAVFAPFISDGLVAIDACTAYTCSVNVITFDEQGHIIDKFCDSTCPHLERSAQKCTKFNTPLPCNVNLKVFRCDSCLKEVNKYESKDKT